MRPRLLALAGPPALALLVLGIGGIGGVAWPSATTISIVGTTDLHGRVFAENGRGGLELFGGFVANLRAARAADGGAVLLVDTGDAYQGGIESNLSEGALVVDAYNALGYTAAAIGNHEFEFGAVDSLAWLTTRSGARGVDRTRAEDPRGALKARAAQAHFPFLAANLIDTSTGRPVEWPNVRRSVIVDAAGIRVGIVGVMTFDALSKTLTANVGGLTVAPLAATIEAEASTLRAEGAQLVIVAAHAGGACTTFGTPSDLSSCDASAEIIDVVRRLPRGLVNVIVAGHTHAAVAHEVEGVAIVQAFSWGRAFSRVDVTIERDTTRVPRVRIFEPREVCSREDPTTARCEPWGDVSSLTGSAVSQGRPARYEGRPVTPDPAVRAAMAAALQRVQDLRATPLDVVFDTPVPRGADDEESALGNLFADALRDLTPGTDVAVSYSAGPGGLRADIAAGPATFGALYDVFPFDNRVVRLTLTGAQLRQMLASQLRRPRARGRALGVSGIRVRVDCRHNDIAVDVTRESGRPIGDGERLVVATTDFMVLRAASVALIDAQAIDFTADLPLVRDAVAGWLREHGTRGGHLRADQFADAARPRWARTEPATRGCLPS